MKRPFYVFLCTTIAFTTSSAVDYGISCYDKPSTLDGIQDFYSGKSDKEEPDMPEPGRSIFFHETLCFGDGETSITAREACAVESAALMNPNMTIFLLVLSPTKLSKATRLLVQQLSSYENVRVRRILISEYIKNTPMEEWYSRSGLNSSKWPIHHMSDILRYLTLWKHGGIYLDLDFVVTSSLDDLINFACYEDPKNVAAGALSFGMDRIGRNIADACINDLKTNFRGDVWGTNGPGVITRVLQKICGTNTTSEMTPSRCQGFKVFPTSDFYPVDYSGADKYFQKKYTNEMINLISKARAMHLWNKISSGQKMKIGSGVTYDIMAKKYCPKVYQNCGDTL